MRAPHRSCRRGGISLLNAIVLCGLLFVTAALVFPACQRFHNGSGGTNRLNACRSNLSNLATAMLLYDGRHGHLPGYMNALERVDGSLYVDPDTGKPTAVSWVVELLSDIDRGPVYDEWRKLPTRNPPAPNTAASGSGDYRTKYLEIFTCPSVQISSQSVPFLNYVANTGMPDLPRATPEIGDAVGTPRDWQANGTLFDNYTESRLVKPDPEVRAPMVTMSLRRIRDLRDKTILISENADAGHYAMLSPESSEKNGPRNEAAWGCVWSPGPITMVDGKPVMSPGDDVLAPNIGTGGSPGPSDIRYARPSSHHPGGFNVAFAGKNVQFINEQISYYIYAKLMASDDANTKLPGSDTPLDAAFRSYTVTDWELNP